jgi:hypothetical protein
MTAPSGLRRLRLALAAALALSAAPLAAARADGAPSYASRAKSVIIRLLADRDFKSEAGCNDQAACVALLARLKAGGFTVVAPAERSDRPDLPSYLRLRQLCPRLDPARVSVAHHTFAATRNFAAYDLDLPPRGRRSPAVVVFRAQHYVARDGDRRFTTASDAPAVLLPGAFVAIDLATCRFLATAPAEDGDWFAKHNLVGEHDHASELLRLDGRYVVLNITPVAAPRQPRAGWWYTLELWDFGPHGDAGLRHQPRLYSFGYKPAAPATPAAASRAAAALESHG